MRAWMVFAGLAAAGAAAAEDRVAAENARFDAYKQAVLKTAGMARDAELQRVAAGQGLQVLDLTWEDTGRAKHSAVGPNISDMTLQSQLLDPRTERATLHCLPILRQPNFADVTGDVPPGKFFVTVGNAGGQPLRKVSLAELLGDLRPHLADPASWKGDGKSLLAPRDTHVLVSAQACFLPIPQGAAAEFNPVLFNYQSWKDNPAVLAILATREGTSCTVIDNARDGFVAGAAHGQRLFFNAKGQRASLSGKRASDVAAAAARPDATAEEKAAAADPGAHVALLIQVPLVHQEQPMRFGGVGLGGGGLPTAAAAGAVEESRRDRSDVEQAVIGHGKAEGKFTEIDGLPIRRDERFPIRVTVQFYQATSNGVATAADLARLAKQIRRVYEDADYVGSLVTAGDTGRPTEPDLPPRR